MMAYDGWIQIKLFFSINYINKAERYKLYTSGSLRNKHPKAFPSRHVSCLGADRCHFCKISTYGAVEKLQTTCFVAKTWRNKLHRKQQLHSHNSLKHILQINMATWLWQRKPWFGFETSVMKQNGDVHFQTLVQVDACASPSSNAQNASARVSNGSHQTCSCHLFLSEKQHHTHWRLWHDNTNSALRDKTKGDFNWWMKATRCELHSWGNV